MATKPMGLMFGLDTAKFKLCKRKFRWLLKLDGISDTDSGATNVLPPLKSSRPSLTFKEMEARHLNEHVFFPMKPDWKPINLVLYDVKRPNHPVFEWIKKCYDPKNGKWQPAVMEPSTGLNSQNNFIKQDATLIMLDATGETIEKWIFENVWPQVAEFDDLDMGSSEFLTCSLTLRYVRAYIEEN